MDIVLIPPHLTHIMQVGDVAVFGPLKRYGAESCVRWHLNQEDDSREMTKYDFWSVMAKPWRKATRAENVLSGFRATGTWPLNPELVLSKIKKKKQPADASTTQALTTVSDHSKLAALMNRAHAVEREHAALKAFITAKGLIDDYTVERDIYLDPIMRLERQQQKLKQEKQQKKKRPMIKDMPDNACVTAPEMIQFLQNKAQVKADEAQEKEKAQQEKKNR